MRTFIAPVLLLLLAVSGASANLIVNGGFETGDFTGWTVTGGPPDCGTTAVDGISTNVPHSGTYAACFANPTNMTFISQTIATVPGQDYVFSMWYAQWPPNQTVNNAIEMIWGGTVHGPTQNLPVTAWTQFQATTTATSTSTLLSIGMENAGGHFAFDDFSLDPVATPEPRLGALCGVALMLLVLRRLRRSEAA